MDERQPTHGDDAFLAAFLSDRDVPCPRCGYNLRMLLGSCCPECGVGVRLGVHPTEPILLLWTTAVVEASVGAGIGLLFIALILGRAGPPPSRWYWIVGLSWACIPTVAAIAWQRRRITRWDQSMQQVLVIVLGAVLLTLLVGIGLNVG